LFGNQRAAVPSVFRRVTILFARILVDVGPMNSVTSAGAFTVLALRSVVPAQRCDPRRQAGFKTVRFTAALKRRATQNLTGESEKSASNGGGQERPPYMFLLT